MNSSRRIVVPLFVLLTLALIAVGPGRTVQLGSARLASQERTSFFDGRNAILVRYTSRLQTASSAPGHLTWEVNLLSPSGDGVGTLTHDIVCSTTSPPPCLVFDATDTFRFSEGTIVNRAKEAIAPDPTDSGWVLVGIHPSGNSLGSGTGAFAGRTGRARMSGHHDGRELPGHATFDDFWLIELDPR